MSSGDEEAQQVRPHQPRAQRNPVRAAAFRPRTVSAHHGRDLRGADRRAGLEVSKRAETKLTVVFEAQGLVAAADQCVPRRVRPFGIPTTGDARVLRKEHRLPRQARARRPAHDALGAPVPVSETQARPGFWVSAPVAASRSKIATASELIEAMQTSVLRRRAASLAAAMSYASARSMRSTRSRSQRRDSRSGSMGRT